MPDMNTDINAAALPSGNGCAECLGGAQPGWWLHLRRCAACGHVGCCDSSPSQHATAHNRSSGHPIMQSYEPGDPFAAMARALGVGIASAATLVPSDFEFGRSCPADAEGVQPIGAGTTVVETFDPETLITGTAPCRSLRW